MKKHNLHFIILLGAILPTFAFAYTVKDAARVALNIVFYLMQTLFALITLGVIYTVFKYIKALRAGDKDAARYRGIFIGAIIGLAVAFALWGIISLLANTLGWTNYGIPQFQAPI